MDPFLTKLSVVKVSEVQKNLAEGKSKRAKFGKDLFASWKGKTWRQILKELRKEDNKKPLDVYLKEIMLWQKRFLLSL